MRVALYARYSSKLQDELSLEAQIAEMEAYVATRGWTVTHRYLLPETASSDVEKSPEFRAMKEAARRREFQLLLVHKLDRFGRCRETSVLHKAELRRLGVQVRSVVENLGDTVIERAMEGMVEVMAEWYSSNLAQETRKGHAQLTRRGYWRGGAVPFGIRTRVVHDGSAEHRALEVDPINGPIMAEVFERVVRGDRTGAILEWIAERTGQPRWSHPTFYTRIANPIYYGLLQFGKSHLGPTKRRRKATPEELVEGRWEGLVSQELWEEAQRTIGRRGMSRHNQPPKQPYLLSEGVAVCAACGRHLIGNRQKGIRYYTCAGWRDRTCTRKSVNADRLEAEFFRQACLDIEERHDLEKVLDDYERGLAPQREAAVRREAGLRKQLTDLRRRVGNLTRALEEGLGDISDVGARLRALKAEEAVLVDEIATCQLQADEAVRLNVAMVREYLRNVTALLRLATPEELKMVYQDLFRLELDLEQQEGQLLMKLAPAAPSGLSVASEDAPRVRSGRSARI